MWEAIGFYSLALFLVFSAYRTITSANPVHSALYLVLTMMGMAAAFFSLGAQFIAGVQMIVYAGAVMVLFVMVLMLFDLKSELRAFSKGLLSGGLKVFSAALLAGIAIGAVSSSQGLF
jgi:NADH-quinone oxidoreductase subunit J